MKYGEYVRSVSGNYMPLLAPSDFVQYDELKTILLRDGAELFYNAWEESFVNLCSKVKELSADSALTKDQRDTLIEFQYINREALRKLMKKHDKQLGLIDIEGGLRPSPQQAIRTRMMDCALPLLQEHLSSATRLRVTPDIENALSPSNVSSPSRRRAKSRDIMDSCHPIQQASQAALATHGPDTQGADATQASRLRRHMDKLKMEVPLAPALGISVFFLLVSFQPILADLTKGGAGQIPYIEATVIGGEAVVSCFLGMALSRSLVTPRNVLRYSPVGVLRAVEDTLSIVCLNYIDPSLYATLAQSRLVLTGIGAWLFLKKAPNKLQFEAMATITLGLVAFSHSYGGSGDSKAIGILMVAVAVVCKVAASIYLDKILKEDGELSVILQSATISAGTIVPTVLYSFLVDWDRLSSGGPFVGWSGLTAILLAKILLKNWLSNVIVKQFSAVVKYVIYAVAVAGTYFLQRVLYQEEVTLLAVVIIAIIVHGAYCYADGKSWVPKPE